MPLAENFPTIDQLRGNGSQEPEDVQEQAYGQGSLDVPKEGIGPSTLLPQGDNQYVVAPAMEDGRVLTEQEAQSRYEQTGEFYGQFTGKEAAKQFQVQHLGETGRENIRSALLLSRGVKPEQIAADKALAKELGVPYGAVFYDRDDAQDESTARMIEKFDSLVRYASKSPTHAAIVRGDIPGFTSVARQIADISTVIGEQAIQRHNEEMAAGMRGQSVWGTKPYSLEDQRLALERSQLQAREAEIGQRYLRGEDVTEDLQKLREEQAKNASGRPQGEGLLSQLPGLNSALEQVYTNIPVMLRAGTEALGIATAAGLAATLATTPVGGAISAFSAGSAAFLASTWRQTYDLESGSQATSMIGMKDSDGNPLSPETIKAASMIYGAISATIEVAGAGMAMKLLAPLGLSAEATKAEISGAIARAAKDKSVLASLADGAKTMLKLFGVEGLEEGSQEALAIGMETAAKSYENATQGTKFDTKLFSGEHFNRLKESFKAGGFAGLWFGVVPGLSIAAKSIRDAQLARRYTDDQVRVHDTILATKTQQTDPEAMHDFLQTIPSMQEEVSIPLDAAVELYQTKQIDILGPLGITPETALEGAKTGQSVTVRLSDLHTLLDAPQFKEAAEIMRRNGESVQDLQQSVQELDRVLKQTIDDAQRTQDVLDGTASLTQEQKTELEAVHAELKQKMTEAIKNVPGLSNQVEIQAGQDPYVNALLNLWRRRAIVEAKRTGGNPADIYRRVTVSAVEAVKNDPTLLQDAFHGTWQDYDEFSTEHIGEGEGNQAHGWGLYFAKAREIADGYRQRLTDTAPDNLEISVNGKTYSYTDKDGLSGYWRDEKGEVVPDYEQDHLSNLLNRSRDGIREDIVQALKEWLNDQSLTDEQRKILLRQQDEYLNAKVKELKPGQLFKVDIPEDDVLLDEQKKFSEQPEKVQNAVISVLHAIDYQSFLNAVKEKGDAAFKAFEEIKNIRPSKESMSDEESEKIDKKWSKFARLAGDDLADTLSEFIDTIQSDESGRKLYEKVMEKYGSSDAPKLASLALNKAGVKGISYEGGLDGRSFVIFDDRAIKVLEKYYQRGRPTAADFVKENFSGDGPSKDADAVGPMTLYQWQNLPEWKRKLTAWMQKEDYSQREINKYIRAIEAQMTIIEALGSRLSEQVVGAGEAAKKKKTAVGKLAYSGPVRSNADEIYLVSFDASSMCVKRLSAAKTAKVAEQTLGRPLTVDEQLALIALYRAAGKDAPCIYCYVESNRRRANEVVGRAREILTGNRPIPKHWKEVTREGAVAAVKEFNESGLTADDIKTEYVLDPKISITEEAKLEKEKYPAIYKFMESQANSTKQNKVKLYEEYRGEFLDLTKDQVELLNGYAGIRFFSTSDFQIEHLVDLIQSMWDMKAMGAKSHAYTKVTMYVRIFGDTGQKINMSCFAKEDPVTGEIRADISQGWDWEEAKKMRQEHPDCGIVFVTSSDRVLRWAMNQDWIDYVIPFHYSGLEKKYYETLGWQDSSSTQLEKPVYKLAKGEKVPRVRMYEIKNADTGHSTIGGMSNAEGTKTYLSLCLERKIYPVFPNFCFKEEVFAPVREKFAKKKEGLTGDALKKVEVKQRSAEVTYAKKLWKAMVEKGEIDWSLIDDNAFKFKKDYARTDTPFNVVDPSKIDVEAAKEPLQDTLDKGLDEKYQADDKIASDLVEMSQYSQEHNVPIGIRALEAARAEKDPKAAIMGTPERETNYLRPGGKTLMQLEEDLNSVARGAVTAQDGNYFIELFKGADMSTLAHEMGHVYFLELERQIKEGIADEQMQADYEKLCKWVGATPGEALTADQHEQLARGWEAYLLEGKAPIKELEGVFQRFREWLLRIYQTVKSLGVELNDEVRGVFDRMLATREEIEATAAENNLLNLTTEELDKLGIPRAQQEYTRQVLENAKARAADRLQRKRDSERRERRIDYRKQAEEELKGSPSYPAYQALADMKKTPLDTLNTEALIGLTMTDELREKYPRRFKEGGADPTIFAAEHGYKSAEEMFSALKDLPAWKDVIKARIDQLDAEYDKQFDATEELLNEEGLSEHATLVAQHLSSVVNRPYIQQQAIASVAFAEMEKLNVKDAMKTNVFKSQMRHALADVRRYINSGDLEKAIAANTKARINLEMARMSQELRDMTDAMQRMVKRFMGSKSVPDTPKYFLNRLAAQHGVMPLNERLAESHTQEDINNWVQGLETEGYSLAIDPQILTNSKPWKAMSLGEFQELMNALKQIIVTERNQRKLLTAKGKEDLAAAVDEITASVQAHGTFHPEKTVEKQSKLKKFLASAHASHMKVEELCIQMDGGKVGGPCWRYIYKPIADADGDQALRLREVRDFMKNKLFAVYSPKELSIMGVKKSFVPEIGESLTMENRLALALNMGNETNIERVMTGHGWGIDEIQAILKPLTEKDWKFVQSVWDYFDTFRDESFKLQEDITGMRPRKVDPLPMTVETSDGKTVDLRGGYYPIQYSRDHSEKQFERDQKEMDKELFAGRNYGQAITRYGHLKERAKGGLQAPLRLELSVIPEHLFNVVHDLAYRRAVLDVAKVIRNRDVQDYIVAFAGRDIYRQLKPWLMDVANERQEPMGSIQKFARWARSSMSIMQMGLKITTMVTQPIGITQTVDVLGAKWTLIGLQKVYGNFWRIPELYRETCARSPMMATRLESYDREIRDITKKLQTSTLGNWVEVIKNKAFVPMGYFQMSVDLPTWWGAYEKGLKEHQGDEQAAADYADSVVRQAQGSGATKDLSAIQRGGDLQRLFTMFYSYFNTLYNLGARHIKELKKDHSPAGIFRAANTAFWLWFLPSALSELVAGRGPEEDEDWEKWLAKTWLAYPSQSVVGVRDIVSSIASGYGYSMTSAESAPEAFVKAFRGIKKAIEKDDATAWVKPVAEAVGYGMGLPLKQPIITVGNMWDYVTDPSSEFYVRDLFFVKPKERR
jgi:methyl-accepting chemotaxis protein